EIKSLIGSSVERVAAGSRLVADAGSTMQEIVGSVKRVTDIVGEIAAAAAEQSQGIGQVNTAVGELDRMTQQNAALVEQSAAASDSLRQQAARLADAVRLFRLAAQDDAGALRPPAPFEGAAPTPAAIAARTIARAGAAKAATAATAAIRSTRIAPAPAGQGAQSAAPAGAAASTTRAATSVAGRRAAAPAAGAADDEWETF
ncbi:MAG: methyl-accepting chemotaxis protein, partial [Burkholderiales bacterium]|nr:methyl-accepting chemotaxis protein [Burkholderiales bacterium]